MRTRQEILDKIRACDERAGSDNPHEAENAARASRDIRRKYDVTDEEMDGSEVRRLDIDADDEANLVAWVAASEVTGCIVVGFPRGARVVGTGSALDEATRFVDHLSTERMRVWRSVDTQGTPCAVMRENICPGELVREQFLLGIAVGATRRMLRAFGAMTVPERVSADASRMMGGKSDHDDELFEDEDREVLAEEELEETSGADIVVRVVPEEPRGRPPIELTRDPSLEFGITAGRLLVALPRWTVGRHLALGSSERPGERDGGSVYPNHRWSWTCS